MITRSLFAACLLASSALAGPPLTTIQDVLYKADGTRFNGILTISWTSFETSDRSAIVTQSTTVKVTDGNLRVQLVPTATSNPSTYYTVIYNSDGRVQFQETWSVPATTQTLRVRDVRVPAPAPANVGELSGGSIPESQVVGLVSDLAARPVKGSSYTTARVALVNSSGALDSVAGSPTDCVRVDGSTGPCGAPLGFVDGDSLSGIVDGANVAFSISGLPDPATSLAVYRNGILLKPGQDYTASGRNLQFVADQTPQPADTLLASYRLNAGSSAPPLFSGPQVLCSGAGGATSSATFRSLGSCGIPSGLLAPGDRVEIRFNFEHQGTTSGFTFEIHWGGTTILHRDAAAGDVLAAGRADAAILASGAHYSSQSWGTVLPFSAAVGSAPDAYTAGLTIDFQGRLTQGSETLTLRGFTVVRLP